MGEAVTPDVLRIRILGEFESPLAIKEAVLQLRRRGYTLMEGYVPWELEGLEDALELPRGRIPLITLIAGIVGAAVGYGVQWWTNAIDYPINVGGRPLNAIPSFVMITFEIGILFAAVAAFLGVILGSRLPMLWQPLFEVPGFERATDDRFFIGIDERDPFFEMERARQDLLDVGAVRVEAVPHAHHLRERQKKGRPLEPPVRPTPGERGEAVRDARPIDHGRPEEPA